ncbi:MAG: hypothetical protein Q4E54_06815 [Lachnospiraceae bacterium]|nr:hypothetical protein [Lachnospiraceae bacterium]MDO4939655.1 hypothetical protein [Lachnospiraceae bacterium]
MISAITISFAGSLDDIIIAAALASVYIGLASKIMELQTSMSLTLIVMAISVVLFISASRKVKGENK